MSERKTRKEAMLMFSKPPIPGMVKTRLTKDRGGIFTGEQAADFFKRSLFDVSEMAMNALFELQAANEALCESDGGAIKTTYDFFVSSPENVIDKMKATFDEVGPWPMEIHYVTDSGKTFDDHFDDAFRQIFDLGYESIVSIGGDIPAMPKSHVISAYQWVEYFHDRGTPGFVQAPCQECGTSLVGYSVDTPINHQGVYYNLDGTAALDAYVAKIRERGIPSAYLPPIADVDELEDLAHTISCLKAMELAAQDQPDIFVARRVLEWIDFMHLSVVTPPNANHDPRDMVDK